MKKLRLTAAFLALLTIIAVFSASCGEKEPQSEKDNIPRAYDYADFGGAAVKKLTIDGIDISEYRIVYGADETEKYAASELAKYLSRATGKTVEVTDDSAAAAEHEIFVGKTNRESGSLVLDRESIGEESFAIRSDGNGRMMIAGGGARGTLYGVYEFLEKYVGWRFIAQDCDVIYQSKKIELKNLDDSQSPCFEWRDPYWSPYFKSDISVKRRVNFCNYPRSIPDDMGGGIRITGSFAHTMMSYTGVPMDEQPCLSDPEIYEKVIDAVQALLDKNPDARIISVTQNDNTNYCKCAKCAAVDEEEGGPSGSMIRFVNKVAEHFEKDYPNLMIHTFAYQYTRKPPEVTKPRDNVVVQICSIECCFNHSLGDSSCEKNKEFIDDIGGWSKICDNIYIWDYTLSAGEHYLTQLNSFHVFGDNLRFLAKYKVIGVFEQGEYCGGDYGYATLRAYLLSKLLWNPNVSDEVYEGWILEFIQGYYGDAWEYIYNLFKFYCNGSDPDEHIGLCPAIEENISNDYLKEHKEEVTGWISSARETAKDDPVLFERVDRCVMLFEYYILGYENLDIMIESVTNPSKNEELVKDELAKWQEKNAEFIKKLVNYKIAVREGKVWTEYIERLSRQSPFEW